MLTASEIADPPIIDGPDAVTAAGARLVKLVGDEIMLVDADADANADADADADWAVRVAKALMTGDFEPAGRRMLKGFAKPVPVRSMLLLTDR